MRKRILAKEAAKLVGVCKRTLHTYTNKGLVRCHRQLNGYRFWYEDELEELKKTIESPPQLKPTNKNARTHYEEEPL